MGNLTLWLRRRVLHSGSVSGFILWLSLWSHLPQFSDSVFWPHTPGSYSCFYCGLVLWLVRNIMHRSATELFMLKVAS